MLSICIKLWRSWTANHTTKCITQTIIPSPFFLTYLPQKGSHLDHLLVYCRHHREPLHSILSSRSQPIHTFSVCIQLLPSGTLHRLSYPLCWDHRPVPPHPSLLFLIHTTHLLFTKLATQYFWQCDNMKGHCLKKKQNKKRLNIWGICNIVAMWRATN